MIITATNSRKNAERIAFAVERIWQKPLAIPHSPPYFTLVVNEIYKYSVSSLN